MSRAQPAMTRRIVYVSRRMTGESLRSALAIKRLDDVTLFGICEQLPDAGRAENFADLICVSRAHDADQLIAAARILGDRHGPLHQLLTAQETLLEPVAQAGEALNLQGMSAATVRRTLNKACMKQTLEQAGIRTARHQLVTGEEDAIKFVREIGFPIVLKPLSGSGGLATWCVRTADQLEVALRLMQPSAENIVLAEEYVVGQEVAIDTITIGNEPRFYSVCCYRPSILEALENPEIQWTCIMPRDISKGPYREVIEKGLDAVRSLQVGSAMTHMEVLLPEDCEPVFIDATLRPAGARIGPMLAFSYDLDPHLAWARAVVDGCFDGPWERKYSVGTIFLRGRGCGQVADVAGIEAVRRRVGQLIVESRLPLVGALKAATYTGDGYITVRHPETQFVADALRLIAETVCINYSESERIRLPNEKVDEQWSQQIQYFDKQLNKPAWEDDSLPTL